MPEPGSLAHGASPTKSSLISLDFGLLGLFISFYGHLVFQTGPECLTCPRLALNSLTGETDFDPPISTP